MQLLLLPVCGPEKACREMWVLVVDRVQRQTRFAGLSHHCDTNCRGALQPDCTCIASSSCPDPGLKPPVLARPGCLRFGSPCNRCTGKKSPCVAKQPPGHALLAAYRSEHPRGRDLGFASPKRGCSCRLHEGFACCLWQVWRACLTMLMDMPLLPEICLHRKTNATGCHSSREMR